MITWSIWLKVIKYAYIFSVTNCALLDLSTLVKGLSNWYFVSKIITEISVNKINRMTQHGVFILHLKWLDAAFFTYAYRNIWYTLCLYRYITGQGICDKCAILPYIWHYQQNQSAISITKLLCMYTNSCRTPSKHSEPHRTAILQWVGDKERSCDGVAINQWILGKIWYKYSLFVGPYRLRLNGAPMLNNTHYCTTDVLNTLWALRYLCNRHLMDCKNELYQQYIIQGTNK